MNRSEAALSRWETGKATPTAYDIRQLAKHLSVPMDTLDLLLFPPSGPVSPVVARLRQASEEGARKGLGPNDHGGQGA
jgi:transcriptional regulator with XRE-family HTH domain